MQSTLRVIADSLLPGSARSRSVYCRHLFTIAEKNHAISTLFATPRSMSAAILPSRLAFRLPRSLRPTTSPVRLFRSSRTKRFIRFNSTSTQNAPKPSSRAPEPAPSLSQRLKQLSKEYGWTALGVYLTLSALDFPFCFLAVRLLGTERIGRWEHEIVHGFWTLIHAVGLDFRGRKQAVDGAVEVAEAAPRDEYGDHGLKEADAANQAADASIWTQLALAYAIHKSFIFIRVPLAAAILPKVVKTLRLWGYKVGTKAPKVR